MKKIKKLMCCCCTCVEIHEHGEHDSDNDSSDDSSDDELRASLLKNEKTPYPRYQDVMNYKTNESRNQVLSTYRREKHKIEKNKSKMKHNSENTINITNIDDDVEFMFTNKYFAPGKTLEQLKEEQKRLNVRYFVNKEMKYYRSNPRSGAQHMKSQRKFKKIFYPRKPRKIQREDSFGRPIFDAHLYMKQVDE